MLTQNVRTACGGANAELSSTPLIGRNDELFTGNESKGVYTLDKQSKFVKSVGLTLVFS